MAMVRGSRFDTLLAQESGAELVPETELTELRRNEEWAEAVTREGIRHAVRSGRLAAEAVARDAPGYYRQRCRREIRGDLLAAVPLSRLFYGFPTLSYHLGVRNPLFLQEFVRIFCGRSNYRRLFTRFPLYTLCGPFLHRSSSS
jgi:flavin-dependent dehydrogenase